MSPLVCQLSGNISGENFALDWWPELKLLIGRESRVIWRNKFLLWARIFQIVVMAIFNGTNLLQMGDSASLLAMNLRRTVGFTSLVTMMLSNLSQLPAFFNGKMVYSKHARDGLFRPWNFVLAHFVSWAPYSVAEACVWSIIIYFTVGLSLHPASCPFWMFLLVHVTLMLNGSSFVRFVTFTSSSRQFANLFASVGMPSFLLFAHFLISRNQIRPFLSVIYWANPMQWASNIIMVNEFLSNSYHNMPCQEHLGDQTSAFFCRFFQSESMAGAYLKLYRWNDQAYIFYVGTIVIIAWIAAWNLGSVFFARKVPDPEPTRVCFSSPGGSQVPSGAPRGTHQVALSIIDPGVTQQQLRSDSSLHGHAPGSTGAFQPVTLSWHRLSYKVMPAGAKSHKQIVSDSSGWAHPAELTAIVGASGTGKTTLLNCLAWRKLTGRMSGSVLVNGCNREHGAWVRTSGYVERVELYPPYLTLKENMHHRAAMRLPRETSRNLRNALVREILSCVGIDHLSEHLLGDLTAGADVESMKRVSIALELSANPSVLFLDSPLTGLDSWQATQLVQKLEHIARVMGRTVIMTSNMLTARQLNYFSNIIVLKTGGETVFFGNPGEYGQAVTSYFESIPDTPPLEPNCNPIGYIHSLIGEGQRGSHQPVLDYPIQYQTSALGHQNNQTLASLAALPKPLSPQSQSISHLRQARQVIITLQLMYWRTVEYTFNRWLYAVLVALLLGGLYFQLSGTTFTGMNSRAAFVFGTVVFGAAVNAGPAISVMSQLRLVYDREKAVKQYPALIYSLGFTLAEIPYLAFTTIIFVTISATMAGVAVQSIESFFSFWFTFFLLSLAITYLGLLLALLFPNPNMASVIVPMLVGAWITTGGYILPRSQIKPFYLWVFWTNPIQYALNSMTSIAFFCDTKSPECSLGECEYSPLICPDCHCDRLRDYGNMFAWNTLRDGRSLERDRIYFDWFFLVIFCVVCRIGSYACLRVLRHHRTPQSS